MYFLYLCDRQRYGMSYNDLLSDPQWLARRKRILKRDHYKCTVCGSPDNLRVHHTFYYTEKTAPWEYPNRSLLTLCNACHYHWHTTHENVIKHRPAERKTKRKAPRPAVRREWVVETLSYSRKTIVRCTVIAPDRQQVRKIMAKRSRPVIGIFVKKVS